MCSRVRGIIICICLLLCVGCALLVGAYRKGWNDAVVKNRVAENDKIIEMVVEKEKIRMETIKKSVPERRKELSRYVVKDK